MITDKSVHLNKDCEFIQFNESTSNRLAIIPNINQITREMTSKNQMNLIIERILKLGIYRTLILAKNNIAFIKEILNKDFATGIKLLCEMEILYSSKSKYLLHNQITDMAIALNNKKMLNNYFYLSKKYKFIPGVITYNAEPLIKFLAKFNSLPNNLIIYTPLQKSNHLNNPSYENIFEYMKNSRLVFKNIE